MICADGCDEWRCGDGLLYLLLEHDADSMFEDDLDNLCSAASYREPDSAHRQQHRAFQIMHDIVFVFPDQDCA